MRKLIFFHFNFLIIVCRLYSQEYSYQDYRNDKIILGKTERLVREDKIDSLKLTLPDYKNRCGFKYYQYKALVANLDSDVDQYKYLDSAFMRGMTPLCIYNHLYKFDTVQVNKSFKENYLSAFNPHLIYVIDSLHYKDQEYRQLLEIELKKRKEGLRKDSVKLPADGTQRILPAPNNEIRIDSLLKLMRFTDSTNLIRLEKVINEYGWPGAKLVGDYYCQRPAPDVSIFFIHLGNTKREYQISNLKNVIELCKKQEESWDNAQSLLFGVHTKFARNFSDFSFLYIQNNHLNKAESYFSVYNMTDILMRSSKYKIEIKCADKDLYEDLKSFMTETSKKIPIDLRENKEREKLGLSVTKELNESSFVFIESPELAPNVIQYKWSLR